MPQCQVQKITKNWVIGWAVLVGACQPAVINSCPPLPVYTQEFSSELANGLQNFPADHPLLLAIEDYIRLRLQLKECQPF
ncbi:MAG: hypothetical protein IPP67_03210 [Rhodospirillaceae bacterium]|nr:hypothetical protein [Rhodospirillaceae bacterium]